MTSPTRKQRDLLTFIDTFIKSNGYGPSYREIMSAFDYKSVSTKKDNSARSLQVVAPKSAGDPEVVVAPVEQVIQAKIAALEQQPDTEQDIKILQKALEILTNNSPA